jgi:hypothetical protein
MFKRGVFRQGRIYSDEGFSVGISDRTHLVYKEGSKTMTVAGELGVNGFVVYTSTIGPWDDGAPIDGNMKEVISGRIKEALSSQGLAVDFD